MSRRLIQIFLQIRHTNDQQTHVWRFLKKLKIELPYNPKIPLLGVYLEKTLIQKDTCTPILTAALFTRH